MSSGFQQRGNSVVRFGLFHAGQPLEYIAHINPGIPAAPPATHDHGVNDGTAPAGFRVTNEQPVLLAHRAGPDGVLGQVAEKYLLRCDAEWKARQSMLGILDEILAALRGGDVRAIGGSTTRNFRQPIQTIIPWATNYFTETLITRVRAEFGDAFWGFWMLGGMSGGGMGFIFAPEHKARAQQRLQEIMSATKRELQDALPFAMEPVVYDFAINERGTFADLLEGGAALMPPGYYTLIAPALLRQDRHTLSLLRRAELDKFGAACRTGPSCAALCRLFLMSCCRAARRNRRRTRR